jgi:hypothetical protein
MMQIEKPALSRLDLKGKKTAGGFSRRASGSINR